MKQDNTLTPLNINSLKVFARHRSYSKSSTKARPKTRKAGQAIVEYVLLVAVCVVIFTMMFGIIRKKIFALWVCEIYPRVGALQGCTNTADCVLELEPIAQCAAALEK